MNENLENMIKKEQLKILVIEDTEKHIEDAKNYFAQIDNVELDFAKTYSEAQEKLFETDWDSIGDKIKVSKNLYNGVISDIYFPLANQKPWNSPEPIGIKIAVELSQLKVPFTLNTAGYHHGAKYEWINKFAREQHWPLIDSGSDYHTDSDSKNWDEAYKSLSRRIDRAAKNETKDELTKI